MYARPEEGDEPCQHTEDTLGQKQVPTRPVQLQGHFKTLWTGTIGYFLGVRKSRKLVSLADRLLLLHVSMYSQSA
jgi:hypothetical protein